MSSGRRGARVRLAGALIAVLLAAACTSSAAAHRASAGPSSAPQTTAVAVTPTPTPTPSPTPRRTPSRTSAKPSPTPSRTPSATRSTTASRGGPLVPAGTGPIIVIDPGHSVSVHGIDPATGLDVSDYENEPEMTDVFAVAQLVRTKLTAAGYRVVLTKNSLDAPTNLGTRADIANEVHAALALSIHDQAGNNGGIGFRSGNNIVYYQAVGDYRETPAGKKVYFTSTKIAALSRRYGQIFQQQRERVQGVPVNLQSNTGYNLGTRGLPAGNIWLVQLLSKVPWIYNEAGGNSAGRSGLDSADKATYADSLVAAVERCVPITH
jgi:N-acetylmuramoyl-L-alanine amidase